MKNLLTIFIFCLFFNLALGEDSSVNFHQSKIILPQGFKELSEAQLTIFKETIFDREIMSVYENKNNGLQRIILYYDSLPGNKNLTFKKIIEIKLEVLKEGGISFENMKIDESNHCAYGKIAILGDTSIFGFSIDEFGIMGIQMDNSNGLSSKDFEKFEHLIKTIKHRSPYRYSPELNPKAKEAKKEMEHSGLLMTIAFIAMIMIGLIRKYAIKNK